MSQIQRQVLYKVTQLGFEPWLFDFRVDAPDHQATVLRLEVP